MQDRAAPPLSKLKIQSLVDDIHDKLEIKSEYFDIIRFVEFILPNIDPTFSYEYVSDCEIEGLYACYNPLTNTMQISSSVYNAAVDNSGRDRFTIAHEVGHYFLHRNGHTYARIANVPTYCNPEWQANTFASMLLVPRGPTKFLDVNEIQNRCKVSRKAAEIAYMRNLNK